MTIRSPITPVRSGVAAAIAAILVFVALLPVTLFLFLQLAPPYAWSPALDDWLTLSFSAGAERLHEQGYRPPNGAFGWLGAPGDYVRGLWPLLQWPPVAWGVTLHLLGAVYVALQGAQLVYRRVQAEQPKTLVAEHVVGPRAMWGKDGRAHLAAAWARDLRQTGHGVHLAPGLAMPRRRESEGILLAGRPGAGKSVILEGLMAQALGREDRVIALDVKGALHERLRRHQPRVLAIGGEATSVWAIGRDLCTAAEADEFAASLVPSSRDPVWGEGSRLLLSGLVQHLQTTRRQDWGWRDLDHLLNVPLNGLEPLIRRHAPAVAQLVTAREEPATFMLSLVFNLAAHVSTVAARFAALEEQGARALSLRAWMRPGVTKRPPLIIRYDLAHRDQSSAFARLVLRVLSSGLLGADLRDGLDSGTWVFLDEASRIGRSDALIDLASLGRSRGVRCVVSVQSPAQLVDVYGPAGAEALRENFGTQVICALPPGDTAKRVALEWIGQRTVAEPARMVKSDRTPREWTLPALSADEIAGELGLHYDLWGQPLIRAAVIGSGDVAVLDWPIRRWSRLG